MEVFRSGFITGFCLGGGLRSPSAVVITLAVFTHLDVGLSRPSNLNMNEVDELLDYMYQTTSGYHGSITQPKEEALTESSPVFL